MVVGVRVVVVIFGGAVGHGCGRGAPVEAVDGSGGRRRPLPVGSPVVSERSGVGSRPGRAGGLGAVEVHMVAPVVRVLGGAHEVLRRQVEPPRVAHGAGVHGPVLVQEVAHVHAGGTPAAALRMLLGLSELLGPGAGLPRGGEGAGGGAAAPLCLGAERCSLPGPVRSRWPAALT